MFSYLISGMIELHEFLMLLKSQHKEAQARIKELVEAPIMVLKSDPSKQSLPPTKGMGLIVKKCFLLDWRVLYTRVCV